MEGWHQYIGFLAAVLTTFAGVPQMVRILKLKESRDVSLWMICMLAVGVVLWLIYGIIIRDVPVIAANSVSLLISTAMIYLVVKYR